ncbi:MAG: glycerol-3-phosphate transporter permease [Legionellaceae bacterium]|nr:glycerol-3-phosphate transporter permease [Legionellaceae bacterium]HAF87263.1 glycerol-3-phosphate transporter permease [Legionellales bacterium]HCA89468.1 glycerol-3-phosphate transporter permease [Legionellales bacterium]|tara:strand:- start:334 stop:1206 length:873 start_codon:yes stop_codon:yes gene_type:complete
MAKYQHYRVLAWLLVLPQLCLTMIFFIWPVMKLITQSLFLGDAFGLYQQFAGWSNFTFLYTDMAYLKALAVTACLTCGITLGAMALGLMMAWFVWYRTTSALFYKCALFWPYAVAPAVAALLWKFLWMPHLGWFAEFASYCGYEINYMIEPQAAFILVMLTACWQQFSYNFLFYLMALKGLPPCFMEAAKLDGASAWQQFWHIGLPLLSPTSLFLFAMNVLYAFFDTFGIVDVLTHGGPNHATTTLMYKIYQDGFLNLDAGQAAAQSVLFMLGLLMLLLVQFKYMNKKST